jgi:hypothetical protein
MGEITPQREAVFSEAFSAICKVATAPKDTVPQLPIQVNIDRICDAFTAVSWASLENSYYQQPVAFIQIM